MREFAFDVQLYACIRVPAGTEAEARTLLQQTVHLGLANFGAWPDGEPIMAEVAVDDELSLIEIDGEAV